MPVTVDQAAAAVTDKPLAQQHNLDNQIQEQVLTQDLQVNQPQVDTELEVVAQAKLAAHAAHLLAVMA